MGIKKTRTRAQIIKEYKAAVKKNPKYGGHIVIDLLPEHLRDYAKEVLKKRKEQYRKTRVIGKLDKKVYLYKYYPWCYRDYKPTLVLQGWYSVKAAKEKYLQFYGPHALKYVKFIRGKDAVEKEFSIGKTLYINGMLNTGQCVGRTMSSSSRVNSLPNLLARSLVLLYIRFS